MGTFTPHFKSLVIHFSFNPIDVQALVRAIEFWDHYPFTLEESIHISRSFWIFGRSIKKCSVDFIIGGDLQIVQKKFFISVGELNNFWHLSHWSPRASGSSQKGQVPPMKRSAKKRSHFSQWHWVIYCFWIFPFLFMFKNISWQTFLCHSVEVLPKWSKPISNHS